MLLLGAYKISPYLCQRLTKAHPAISLCQGPSVSGPGLVSFDPRPPSALEGMADPYLFNPKNIMLWQNQSHFSVFEPVQQSL